MASQLSRVCKYTITAGEEVLLCHRRIMPGLIWRHVARCPGGRGTVRPAMVARV